MVFRLAGLAIGGLTLLARTATTQQPGAVADSTRRALCQGQRITTVEVRAPDHAAVDEVRPAFIRPVVRALLQTAPTRPGALRPYVLLDAGDTCREDVVRESERLVRNLHYVADAAIRVEPDSGGVRLVLTATDELKPVLGLRLDGATPEYAKFGSVSLGGRGIAVAAEWRDGGGHRDGFALRASDWTLGGRRIVASAIAARHPLGDLTHVEIGSPYVTPLQSVAWSVALSDETDFVRLERNVDEPVAWRTEWRTWNAGLLGRVRLGATQLLAGGLYINQRITPAESGIVIASRGFLPAPSARLQTRYDQQDVSRAGVVVGVRTLSFLPAQGLEALYGVQDIARGLQIALALGRAVSGEEDEPFVAAEISAGVGREASFATARATFERQRKAAANATQLLSGRLAWYWRASRRQTQELTVDFAGIWRDDIPVALFLDDARAGPRGVDGATASGTRLIVARAERRIRAGGFGRAVGFGLAGFADVAKLWAGDAPLGETLSPTVGIGAGLLLAIPHDSRKTFRIEAAYPLTKVAGASGLDVRLVVTTAGRSYWREPAAFVRSRLAPSLRTLIGWF